MFPLQRGRLLVELSSKQNSCSPPRTSSSKRFKANTGSGDHLSHTRQCAPTGIKDISITSSILETDPGFSFNHGSEIEFDMSSILAASTTTTSVPMPTDVSSLNFTHCRTSTDSEFLLSEGNTTAQNLLIKFIDECSFQHQPLPEWTDSHPEPSTSAPTNDKSPNHAMLHTTFDLHQSTYLVLNPDQEEVLASNVGRIDSVLPIPVLGLDCTPDISDPTHSFACDIARFQASTPRISSDDNENPSMLDLDQSTVSVQDQQEWHDTNFQNTFCLNDWTIRSWCINECHGEKVRSTHYDRALQQRRHCTEDFLKKLHHMPSHYCRKSTSKFYLERQFRAMVDVHQAYKQQCVQDDIAPVSIKIFTSLFREQNLALFFPRKDQCDVCVQHEMANLDEPAWIRHCEKCKSAQDAKCLDKTMAESDSDTLVISMDLQAVLLSPALLASALYYKTKLTVHNFTIYNMGNKDVDCYVWHEAEGGLTANEFASCLFDYLSKNLVNKTKCVIYSDGCTYQNRNKTISKMLCLIAKQFQIEVQQKYLEKGHTQMECDSVHATIERALNKKGKPCNIYLPSDYARIIADARKSGQPYAVHYLDHTFFKNFDNVASWSSIRPGKMAGDPTVVNIRVLRYVHNETIFYKLDHNDDWTLLPRSRADAKVVVDEMPRRLYDRQRKITEDKFKHLQQMKIVLPKDVHAFYDNLPH